MSSALASAESEECNSIDFFNYKSISLDDSFYFNSSIFPNLFEALTWNIAQSWIPECHKWELLAWQSKQRWLSSRGAIQPEEHNSTPDLKLELLVCHCAACKHQEQLWSSQFLSVQMLLLQLLAEILELNRLPAEQCTLDGQIRVAFH